MFYIITVWELNEEKCALFMHLLNTPCRQLQNTALGFERFEADYYVDLSSCRRTSRFGDFFLGSANLSSLFECCIQKTYYQDVLRDINLGLRLPGEKRA